MKLSDEQKAILLYFWYKGDGWHDPADMASVVNLVVVDLIFVANSLCAAGLVQSRKCKAADGEWQFQYVFYRKYKLVDKGKDAVRDLLDIINGKLKEVKL